MDGLEWKRSKYSKYVQRFLKYAEKLAVNSSDQLVADSPGIQDYLKKEYSTQSSFIAYPAKEVMIFDESLLKEYSLEPGKYDLVIARMEPENNIEEILKSYENSSAKLILFGSYNNKFGSYLKNKYTGINILFAGALYNKSTLNSLRHFCRYYLHGHSVGGTNPSLLEAMSCGCHVISNDNPFNRAVLKNNAMYFNDSSDLIGIINTEIDVIEKDRFLSNNQKAIRDEYSTEKIGKKYLDLFISHVK